MTESEIAQVVDFQRWTGSGQDTDNLRVRIVLSPERRADLTGSLDRFNTSRPGFMTAPTKGEEMTHAIEDSDNAAEFRTNPPLTISRVQETNLRRANRWHGGDFRNWSGLEWAGALCGEAGEAANVAKKLRRVELELDGNAKSERPLVPADLVEKLAAECADTFLYLTLLASRYDINLAAAVRAKFNQKSVEMGFPERI